MNKILKITLMASLAFAGTVGAMEETSSEYFGSEFGLSEETSYLFGACLTGNVFIAKLLIDCGADVGAVLPDGRTVLHVAAEKGYLRLVQYLVVAGADREAQTIYDKTAVTLAKQNGQTDVVKFLNQKSGRKSPVSGNCQKRSASTEFEDEEMQIVRLTQDLQEQHGQPAASSESQSFKKRMIEQYKKNQNYKQSAPQESKKYVLKVTMPDGQVKQIQPKPLQDMQSNESIKPTQKSKRNRKEKEEEEPVVVQQVDNDEKEEMVIIGPNVSKKLKLKDEDEQQPQMMNILRPQGRQLVFPNQLTGEKASELRQAINKFLALLD